MIRNLHISLATQERLAALLLLALTIGVYWQVLNFDFISFDDPMYVLDNPHVLAGLTWSGVAWAFTSFEAANWHPLTWLSHMLDVQLYGLNPAGHHLMNVILHAVNSLLLFLLLRETTHALWRSFLIAALFALHPLHIESVAWVSERKDVLCAFFWLLTMLLYVRYARGLRNGWYIAALLCFVLGLMSKPMIVTLPFVLILFDFWPLRRFGRENRNLSVPDQTNAEAPLFPPVRLQRLVLEKMPFLLLTVAASIITYTAQNWRAGVATWEALPINERIWNAGYSYILYIYKMFWPIDLAVFYPHPGKTLALWIGMAAIAGIGAITSLIVSTIRRKPYTFVGWFWFLGTLVPVIGIIQVGNQGMADRYTYLPFIGLFLALVWGVADLLARLQISPRLQGGLMIAVLLALVSLTGWQLTYWKNSYSLFSRALAVTRENHVAHYALAMLDKQGGNVASYQTHYRSAVAINPIYVATMENRTGYLLLQAGRIAESIEQFKTALRNHPKYLNAANNLGVALAKQGRFDEAIPQFEEVLRKNPRHRQAQESLDHIRREKAASK
jgi:tetratricopeptide (TPR) repeat protein